MNKKFINDEENIIDPSIEFRAWDKENKRMVYVGDKDMPDLTPSGCPVHFLSRENLSLKYKLMRYLGVKGANQIKIYECDVVEAYLDLGPGGVHKYIIEATYSPFGISIPKFNFLASNLYPKVIGNVLNNPELKESIGKEIGKTIK